MFWETLSLLVVEPRSPWGFLGVVRVRGLPPSPLQLHTKCAHYTVKMDPKGQHLDKHGGVHFIATWTSYYLLTYNPLEGLFLFGICVLFKRETRRILHLGDHLGLKGERQKEPWWSRVDERLDPLHEEVCDCPGFCSYSPGLGEWSQKITSTGECLVQVSFCQCNSVNCPV